MKKLICIFGFIVTLFNLSAQDTLSALFIGNSYTYSNAGIPSIVADLATANDDLLIYDSNTPGGYTLQGHTTNATSLSKIAQGTWDFVVLQEQSQKPSFSYPSPQINVFPYAETLDSLIHEANECAKTMFFMTWGRENGDAGNCQFFDSLCTFNGMNAQLRKNYLRMAEMTGSCAAPVGAAWKNVRDQDSLISLYAGDGSHPNGNGTYLAACVFYASMFQKTPVGIPFYSTVNPTIAQFLQQVAAQTVLDSTAFWYQDQVGLNAYFSASNVSDTVTFVNNSTNAADYFWDFGDGTTSTEMSPTHVYGAIQDYEVCLVATSNCGVDTLCDSVSTQCPAIISTFEYGGNGTSLIFNESAIGATSWHWEFGDGATSSQQHPNHTYTLPGLYDVCLISMNYCDSDTFCITIPVNCPLPVIDFSVFAQEYQVTLTNNSTNVNTYEWSMGDEGTSFEEAPTWLYNDTGSYIICLVAENTCGIDSLCLDVDIECPVPNGSFAWNKIENYEFNFIDYLYDADSLSWTINNVTYPENSPTIDFGAAGFYEVCISGMNSCGTFNYCDSLMVLESRIEVTSVSRSFKICPNPVQEHALISNDVQINELEIFSIDGILVLQAQPKSKSYLVNLTNLETGIYFIQIRTFDKLSIRKIIVQ